MKRSMIIAGLLMGLFFCLRVWGWMEWKAETLCLGCEIEFSQRLWQEPEEKWYGWRWRYKGEWVVCEADNNQWDNKNRDPSTFLNQADSRSAQDDKSDLVSLADFSSGGCDVLERYQIGDKLLVRGVVEEWELQGKVVGKMVEVRKLKSVGGDNIWVGFLSNWLYFLNDLRAQIVNIYQQYLDEPYAGLLAGIVVGEQSELGEEFYQDLVATGTLHVVAASGYNITIVAGVMLAGLVWVVRRREAVWLALAGVWMYVGLAGMSPAVVRAGLMGSLFFVAQAAGKEYAAKWGLVLSAAVMVMLQPWMMVDVSFQLSVMASAGILWGLEPISLGIRRFVNSFLKLIGNSKYEVRNSKHIKSANNSNSKQREKNGHNYGLSP